MIRFLLWLKQIVMPSLVTCGILVALQVIWMSSSLAQTQGQPTATPYPTPAAADYAELEGMRLPWDEGQFDERGLSDDWVDHWKDGRTVGLSWDFAKPDSEVNVKGTTVLAPSSGYVQRARSMGGGYGGYADVQTATGWGVRLAHMALESVVLTRCNGIWVPRGVPIGILDSTGFSTGPHIHMELYWHEGRPPAVGDLEERGQKVRLPLGIEPFGVDQESLNNRTSGTVPILGNQSPYRPKVSVFSESEMIAWDSKTTTFQPRWILFLGTEEWSILHEYHVTITSVESEAMVLDTDWISVTTANADTTCGFFGLPSPQPGTPFMWQKLERGEYVWSAQVRFPDIREGYESTYFYSDPAVGRFTMLDLADWRDRIRWNWYRIFHRPVDAAEGRSELRFDPPTPLPSPEEMAERYPEQWPEPYPKTPSVPSSADVCAQGQAVVRRLVQGLNTWDRSMVMGSISPGRRVAMGLAWAVADIFQKKSDVTFRLQDIEYDCLFEEAESATIRVLGVAVIEQRSSGEVINWFDEYYVDVAVRFLEGAWYIDADVDDILKPLSEDRQ